MALSMKDIRALPGETRSLVGYLDSVTVQEPTDKDRENAAKYKREAKVKTFITFSPNKLEARKIKFDPVKFPVEKLLTLEGACIEIGCEVNPWEFTDERTGELKKGESSDLVKLIRIFRDANGQEPAAK